MTTKKTKKEQPLEFHIKLSKFELEQLLKGKVELLEIAKCKIAGFPALIIIEKEKVKS
jgi:hypothetical protein